MLFVGCAVPAVYDKVEPIPEEKPEEPTRTKAKASLIDPLRWLWLIPSKVKYKIC